MPYLDQNGNAINPYAPQGQQRDEDPYATAASQLAGIIGGQGGGQGPGESYSPSGAAAFSGTPSTFNVTPMGAGSGPHERDQPDYPTGPMPPPTTTIVSPCICARMKD